MFSSQIAGDPAGKINKYEYFPMKAVVPHISVENIQ